MKVPDVKRCCLCIPLRWGMMMFALVNMHIIDESSSINWLSNSERIFQIGPVMLSMLTLVRLVIVSKHVETAPTRHYLEVLNTTLFHILAGGALVLSALLIVGGYQKDVSLLRLYNCYAIALLATVFVQSGILFLQAHYNEFILTLFICVIQIYLILVVRSDIIKLETTQATKGISTEDIVEVPDRVTLL